jgi:hypothetical protein
MLRLALRSSISILWLTERRLEIRVTAISGGSLRHFPLFTKAASFSTAEAQ